ncbi:MAG: tetratricopeptide repeat protein [Nitrospirota bacterium]
MDNIKKKHIVAVSFITILISIIHLNSLYSPFLYDDIRNIVDNNAIHLTDISVYTLKNIVHNSSISRNRPITNITFAINYYFGGLEVYGYHIVNIIIHIITAITIYLFLYITLEMRVQKTKDPCISDRSFWIGMIAALLWSTSPVQTQAVTYIVQRATSMATMFYMMSLLCYVNGRISGGRGHPALYYLLSTVFAFLAFGSKEISATLPFVIILYEIYFFTQSNTKRMRKRAIYFTGIIMVSVLIFSHLYMDEGIISALKRLTEPPVSNIEQQAFTAGERILTQFRVIIYYITLLILPLPSRLRVLYNFPVSHSLFDPLTTIPAIVIILGLIVYALSIVRKRGVISFFMLWFFLNLVIESLITRLHLVFEHRLYLPSIGFFVIVGVGMVKFTEMVKYRKNSTVSSLPDCLLPAANCIIIIAVIFIQSLWTIQRNYVWQDVSLLWRDNIKKEPYLSDPHNELGVHYYSHGDIDSAVKEYKMAIEIDPDYTTAHNNLAQIYEETEETEPAIEQYIEVIRSDPSKIKAYINLAMLYEKKEDINMAVKVYKLLKERYKDNIYSYIELGRIYTDQKKWDMAIDEYKRVIEIFPNAPLVYNTLGILYKRTGRIDLSIDAYKKALRLDPDIADAHYNLGLIYFEQGNLDMALKEFKDSIRNDSARTIAYYNMGVIYYKQGRSELAIKEYKEALKRKPNYPEALYNLAYTLDSADKLDEAIIYYEKFLKLADKDERYKEFAEKAKEQLKIGKKTRLYKKR